MYFFIAEDATGSPRANDETGDQDLQCPVRSCARPMKSLLSLATHILAKHVNMTDPGHDEDGVQITIEPRIDAILGEDEKQSNTCSQCQKRFHSKSNLIRHQRTIHGSQDEKEQREQVPEQVKHDLRQQRERQEQQQEQLQLQLEQHRQQLMQQQVDEQQHLIRQKKRQKKQKQQQLEQQQWQQQEQREQSDHQGHGESDNGALTDVLPQCSICEKYYKNAKSLGDHMWKVHQVSAWATTPAAPVAPEMMVKMEPLSREPEPEERMDVAVPNGSVSCRVCDKEFLLSKHLRAHEKSLHHLDAAGNSSELRCTYCKQAFALYEDLKSHVKADHSGLFTCAHCDRVFKLVKSMKQHVRESHKDV